MPFKKSQEEKAQKQAEREAEAYAASPVGRAEAAHKRGDTFFQVEIDVQPDTPSWGDVVSSVLASVLPRKAPKAPEAPKSTDVLGDIERIGWQLEHAGYVYVQTGSSSSGDSSNSQHDLQRQERRNLPISEVGPRRSALRVQIHHRRAGRTQ